VRFILSPRRSFSPIFIFFKSNSLSGFYLFRLILAPLLKSPTPLIPRLDAIPTLFREVRGPNPPSHSSFRRSPSKPLERVTWPRCTDFRLHLQGRSFHTPSTPLPDLPLSMMALTR